MANSLTRITKLENGTLVIQGVYDTVNQDLLLIDPTNQLDGVAYNQLRIIGYSFAGNTGAGLVSLKATSDEIIHQVSLTQNDSPVVIPDEDFALATTDRDITPAQTLTIRSSVILNTFSVYVKGVYLGEASGGSNPSTQPTLTGANTVTGSTTATTNYVVTISNYSTLNALPGATWDAPTVNVGTVTRGSGGNSDRLTAVIPANYTGNVSVGIGFTETGKSKVFATKTTDVSIDTSTAPTLSGASTHSSNGSATTTYTATIDNYTSLNGVSGSTWGTPTTNAGYTVARGTAGDANKIFVTVPANASGSMTVSITYTAPNKLPNSGSVSTTISVAAEVSATPTITGGSTGADSTPQSFSISSPIPGTTYTWSATEGSFVNNTGTTVTWTPAILGTVRNVTISCVAQEPGKSPSTAGTRVVAVSGDPVANTPGVIAWWNVNDASTTTTALNQTFASSDVNTTSGNLVLPTLPLPAFSYTAEPDKHFDPADSTRSILPVPIRFTTTGTLPAPLALDTDYYCRKNTAGTEIEIYPVSSNSSGRAVEFHPAPIQQYKATEFYFGVNKIALTSGGTGTHSITTNPLHVSIPSKTSFALNISNTNTNLNHKNEVLTDGSGVKYLNLEGPMAQLRGFGGNSTTESVGNPGFPDTIAKRVTATIPNITDYSNFFVGKRWMYLVAGASFLKNNVVNVRRRVLAPANINTNGTITFTLLGGHGLATPANNPTEVFLIPTTGSTLPAGMPGSAWARGNTATTFTLFPTMADATAGTNLITYSNTGSGVFVCVDKTDIYAKPDSQYWLTVDFPQYADYPSGSGNGSAAQRVLSVVGSSGFYGSLANIGPTNTQTATLCDSLKRIQGIMITANGGTATTAAPIQKAYPVRCITNGTYPTITDVLGGVLSPFSTYWAVPLNNSPSNLCWLFRTKALADAWVATNPANTGNPTNAMTLANTGFSGRLQWFLSSDDAGTPYSCVSQSDIVPSVGNIAGRYPLLPNNTKLVYMLVLDCNDPAETFWTYSIYINGVLLYKGLFNNSDVRNKGLLVFNGGKTGSGTVIIGSPAQDHLGGGIQWYGGMIGATNTDPTSTLLTTISPYFQSLWNV
jgi:hypothetical protein